MYYFESRIRYSELDLSGNISIEALLNYFQDCSTFHSEAVGMGPKYLAEANLGWVLVYWQIVIERRPVLGEEVRIGTAPYDFKGVMGFRNFIMETKKGERLACANTIWTLIDLKKQCPVKAGEEIRRAYHLEAPLSMNYAPRKIAVPELTPVTGDAVFIKHHHLDTNDHVNNVQYIGIAMEQLPEHLCVREMRAEYKKQARIGDKMIPLIYKCDHDVYTIALQSEENKPYCIAEFQLVHRNSNDQTVKEHD